MDFYEVLGLEFGSNLAHVKQAYRTLALHYHPDKTVSLSEEERKSREDKLKSIAAVYEVLGDEREKEQYDRFRLEGGLPNDFESGLKCMSPSPTAASDDDDARNTRNDDFESYARRNEYTRDNRYNHDNDYTSDYENARNDEYTYNKKHTRTNEHTSAKEYTPSDEYTRHSNAITERKGKRASSTSGLDNTSLISSVLSPAPRYDADSYVAKLGPRFFRYERSLKHLHAVATKINRNRQKKAIVVAVVRREQDRKNPSTTFAEHVVIATPSSKGQPSLRVQDFDIESNPLKLKWSPASRSSSFAHASIAIYGYWLAPFDVKRHDELNDYLKSLGL